MKFLSLLIDRPDGWTVLPDSTGLPSDRPLFIPETDSPVVAIPMIAVRIARLGKCIARRFAHRYYNSWAPALQLVTTEAIEAIDNGRMPSAHLICFDNAIVTGEMTSTDCNAFRFNISDRDATPDKEKIDLAIEMLSRLNTLKTGDIILIPALPHIKLAENMIIEAYTSDNNDIPEGEQTPHKAPLLRTKIK